MLTWNQLQEGINSVNESAQDEHQRMGTRKQQQTSNVTHLPVLIYVTCHLRAPGCQPDKPGCDEWRPPAADVCSDVALLWTGGGLTCQHLQIPDLADQSQTAQSPGNTGGRN